MDDLTEFLRARIAEDEAVARAAKSGPWHVEENRQDLTRWVANEEGSLEVGLGYVGNRTQGDAAHIARYDPARALRDVEARRKVVECHEPWTATNGDIICGRCGREHIDGRPGGHFPCQTLRLLAAVYADHPDYREEWRP